NNVVTKSGSFFSYGDERLGQGRNNAKAFLVEHPEVAKEIEDKIYAALGIDRDLVATIERADDPAPPMPEEELEADDEPVAEAAVAQGAEHELGVAVELLRRRFPAPPETDRDRERALGLLVRRGYDLELAYDAVRALGREAA